MAYQKTDGTLQDAEYIVTRLIEGFSYDEAIQGMKMPIDPGTPERPGWCYRNKQLLLGFAAKGGVPVQRGMTTPNRKPITYLADKEGKMWAIFGDNTREEVKPSVEAKPAVVVEHAVVPVTDSVAMAEEDIPREAKRSRRKIQPVTKEWPK